ncbi:MAG: hypothetical protein ABWY92_06660, partial [Xanthobacteraceae bacterium]
MSSTIFWISARMARCWLLCEADVAAHAAKRNRPADLVEPAGTHDVAGIRLIPLLVALLVPLL